MRATEAQPMPTPRPLMARVRWTQRLASQIARGPERVRGRIEARGLGLVEAAPLPLAALALAVAADPAPERLPDPETLSLAGQALPLLRLAGFEASVVEKVAAAIAPL
jgi:hypothetical protein